MFLKNNLSGSTTHIQIGSYMGTQSTESSTGPSFSVSFTPKVVIIGGTSTILIAGVETFGCSIYGTQENNATLSKMKVQGTNATYSNGKVTIKYSPYTLIGNNLLSQNLSRADAICNRSNYEYNYVIFG